MPTIVETKNLADLYHLPLVDWEEITGRLDRGVTQAPGTGGHGSPQKEFTWFKGYAWTVQHCRGCNDHLGWKFEAPEDVFFGLIKPKLTTQKPEA